MADEKWSGFDEETTTTNIEVPVLYPDGASGTGFKNARIAIANFFSTLWTQININTAAIAALLARVVTLEDSLSKTYDAATGTTTIVQPADSLLTFVSFTVITGTPSVKIGTTAGGNDIVYGEDNVASFFSDNISKYTATSRTLYITITSGTCDVVTFQRLNLNS